MAGVLSPAAVLTQPTNQTVTAGQIATFGVTVAGTAPLAFQWLQNNVLIANATNAFYTTLATAQGDSGATFAVMVTNAADIAFTNHLPQGFFRIQLSP